MPNVSAYQMDEQPELTRSANPTSAATSITGDGGIDFLKLPDDMNAQSSDGEVQRGMLFDRSSYRSRKYFGDLTPEGYSVSKVEDESSDGQITQDSNDTSDGNVADNSLGGQTFHVVNQTEGNESGAQAMSNIQTSGATIVQYAQGPDGHFFIPVHQLAPTNMVSFPQSIMVSGGVGVSSPQQLMEEASRKRELRLLKNKEAAKECRRKKKEYVKCLENRVAILENQNKTLIEELKSLKELYCQKEAQS